MRDGLRRSHAIALMALVHIVAGFATAGITSDTQRSLHVAIGMFVVTGALLTVRLCARHT